jgi:hypothetical protein
LANKYEEEEKDKKTKKMITTYLLVNPKMAAG